MNLDEAKSFLENCDNVTILTHKGPDGDTLGSGFALVNYLRLMGKKANVINSDVFPSRYSFLYEGYAPMKFEEKCVIAVDIADKQLLGKNLERYKADGAVDLCIDHHISNCLYAKETLLLKDAAAACEVMYLLFKIMAMPINTIIAKCLYTGIATDTGCFKYENTTSRTHAIAGELMQFNIDYAKINRAMFDVKSKGRVIVENTVSGNMEFFFDDRCSMITIQADLIKESGIEPAEFDGLASIPLQVEGVQIGVTVKQKEGNKYKLSVRTTDEIDASALCSKFGGGGHVRAAGCEVEGTLSEVKAKVLSAIKDALGN